MSACEVLHIFIFTHPQQTTCVCLYIHQYTHTSRLIVTLWEDHGYLLFRTVAGVWFWPEIFDASKQTRLPVIPLLPTMLSQGGIDAPT